MRIRLSFRPAPRSTAALIAVLIAVIAPLQVGALMSRGGKRPAPNAVASPFVEPTQSESPSASPSPSPSKRKTSPTPKPSKAPQRADAFRGLGAWIDVYDFKAVDVDSAVDTMRANGVRTLYIQTGRHNTPYVVAPEVGPWLVAAHRAGLKVVGWYLPGYRSMDKEIQRTVAIARYRYRGEAFDALGIDIEDKSQVRHVPTWNARVARHAQEVRARLPRYPIAAITPTPIGMAVAPSRWAGFPWRDLADSSDALMLMSYWSYRSRCPDVPEQCAYGYTLGNLQRARTLIDKPSLPIHIIGGVADLITAADVVDFVRGARDGRAYGTSLYDFRTTDPSFWKLLGKGADL